MPPQRVARCGGNATFPADLRGRQGTPAKIARMSPWLSIHRNGSAKEGNMRFGESHDEACRYCGSTQIVVWPPTSAGQCAVCSDDVRAHEARLDQLAERKLARARAAFAAAEAARRAAERGRLRAERRAALAEAGRTLAQRGATIGGSGLKRLHGALLRALPARSRTAHNY
jgi:hypothetical protein